MKNKISTIIIFALYSCVSDIETPEVLVTPEIYQSCCGTKPVEFKLSTGYVYMPNVFTPNGDGVNDYFYPFINKDIQEVNSFKIFSAVGDTLLFRKNTINYTDIKNSGWNGTRSNAGGFFESNYTGLFKYDMRIITNDKKLIIIKGEACAIQCGKDTRVFQTKEGCYYSTQAGTDGVLDKTKKNNETKCF